MGVDSPHPLTPSPFHGEGDKGMNRMVHTKGGEVEKIKAPSQDGAFTFFPSFCRYLKLY
jgi:hypothetical protein